MPCRWWSRCATTSAYTFTCSPRKGTRAAEMPGRIAPDVASERIERLIALQEKITGEVLSASMRGETVQALVEGVSRRRENQLTGKTGRNINVNFNGAPDDIGKIVRVQRYQRRQQYPARRKSGGISPMFKLHYNVYEKVEELAKLLAQSSESAELQAAEDAGEKDPELSACVAAFIEKRQQLENETMKDEKDFDLIGALTREIDEEGDEDESAARLQAHSRSRAAILNAMMAAVNEVLQAVSVTRRRCGCLRRRLLPLSKGLRRALSLKRAHPSVRKE